MGTGKVMHKLPNLGYLISKNSVFYKKDRLPGLTGSRSFFNFKYYFLYAPTFPSPISCPIFRMWSPIRSKSVSISE